jgi:Tfp pilus assembly protein PilE
MKNFYFDFIAIPRSWVLVRWVFLIAGVLTFGAVVAYQQTVLRPQIQEMRAQVQSQRDAMGVKPVVSTMKPQELTQAWRQAQAASVQLNLPWSSFFVGLNDAATAGKVALMSIEPDTQRGQVVLVSEARDFESMLKFVKAMQERPEFDSVVLLSHTINRALPEKPVRFRMSAQWKVRE